MGGGERNPPLDPWLHLLPLQRSRACQEHPDLWKRNEETIYPAFSDFWRCLLKGSLPHAILSRVQWDSGHAPHPEITWGSLGVTMPIQAFRNRSSSLRGSLVVRRPWIKNEGDFVRIFSCWFHDNIWFIVTSQWFCLIGSFKKEWRQKTFLLILIQQDSEDSPMCSPESLLCLEGLLCAWGHSFCQNHIII